MAETAEKLVLNMGPHHPSTHGVLRLIVTLDGETLVDIEPDIGFLHRCFEKTCENWTYPQIVPLTDRTDYLASMTNEWPYVMAVETLMGIRVPERAEYIRVIAGELQRIASHVLWWAFTGLESGAMTTYFYGFRDREMILDLFQMLCGARLTYNFFRIGGVRNDLPEGFIEKARKFLDYFESYAHREYETLLSGNRIFQHRIQDIGILTAEDAVAWGATGPVLRASGVKYDLRKDDPYSVYDRFEFNVPVGVKGDIADRYAVRMQEMLESCKIVRQALDQIPDGEVMAKVPKVIKPPAGEVYSRIEAPRGEVGCYLVSDGSPKPYRLKWRSPCYVHTQILPLIGRGYKIADLVMNIGSIDLIMGEVDR